jgi:cytochrome b561
MFIPFIVWDQSFGQERIQDTYSKLIEGDLGSIPVFIQIIALILIIGQFIFVITRYYFAKKDMQIQYSRSEVKTFFITHFGIYALYSLLITGAIISTYRIEQYLYLLNYAIILFALPKLQSEFTLKSTSYQKWVKFFIMVLVIIAALALIAISTHGEMPGMHRRFEF